MSIPSLNFRRKSSSTAGSFSRQKARDLIDKQFGKLNLTSHAKEYLAKKIDNSGRLEAREMNEIINKAHQGGYISSRVAEKMKDITKLPDRFNKHWE